jgi:hypothetical protein
MFLVVRVVVTRVALPATERKALSRRGVAGATMNTKRKAVVDRIESLGQDIRRAREYLESGKHSDWHGFRPLFVRKKELPPHKDWVKNVFLPRREKALARAEKLQERLVEQEAVRLRDRRAPQRTGRAERSL